MRRLNIGKMKQRVTVCRLEDVETRTGIVERLTEVRTVWATLTPIRGKQYFENKKAEGEITHKCYMRYMDGIDNNCYLKCKGKTYAVTGAIDVDSESSVLEILCSEYVSKGDDAYGV